MVEPIVTISRDIPITWLISGITGLIAHVVIMWTGFRRVEKAVEKMAEDRDKDRERTSTVAARVEQHAWQLDDHGRRIDRLEVTK